MLEERERAEEAKWTDEEMAGEAALAERLLAEQLLGGEPKQADAEAEAIRRLPPRWEIRIQTDYDPVVEETKKYRQMAKEVDDRYDRARKPDSP